MHKKAEEYDNQVLEEHYKKNPPKDRPCDWCGEPVKGEKYTIKTIHDKCLEMKRRSYIQGV